MIEPGFETCFGIIRNINVVFPIANVLAQYR
jgi:hypothetical protein